MRATRVAKWFIERLSGRLGRTHLVKLVYLSDGLARAYLGRPITELDYIEYDHGPYDGERFPAVVRELETRNLAVE